MRKIILFLTLFLVLASGKYVHATQVSDPHGHILIFNADGSINVVSVGVSTSIVTGSSVTLNSTVYQNADWKVNFDSTTGRTAIYFTGMLPAGTNSIGGVTGDSDTFKAGAEIMNWLADYPDAALLAGLLSVYKNISITSGTITQILDLICSSDNAKVAAEIMNFPADYPDAAVLAAIISGFKNVVISSGADVEITADSDTTKVGAEILNWLADFPDANLLAAVISGFKNVVISSGGISITDITSDSTTTNGTMYQPSGYSYNVDFSTVNIRALCGATTNWVDIRTESCGSPNLRMAIYSGDVKLNIVSINDGDSAGFYGGLMNSRLQAYNATGNVFDRLRLDGTDAYRSLWVRTSTNSHTQVDNTVTTADERYSGKVSTHTAGKLNASGNIPSTDFDVTAWAYYSVGSTASVTGLGGTSWCLANVGNTSPPLELHFASPTMAVDLGFGGTFYYEVWGSTTT